MMTMRGEPVCGFSVARGEVQEGNDDVSTSAAEQAQRP
jgi:hypothetical protein